MGQFREYVLESSQYGGDIYRVSFSKGELSWVHARTLENHPKLLCRVRKGDGLPGSACLDLKDIDSPTGYVILHYLYTGTYRCRKALYSILMEKIDAPRHELAEGLEVCAAACSLQMWELRNLAEKEIERLSDQLSVAHVFDIIDIMGFQLTNAPTFKSYLKSRIGQGRFARPGDTIADMLQDFGTTNTLSKLTLETMISQHTSRMEQGSEVKTALMAQQHATASDHPATLKTEAESPSQSVRTNADLLKKESGREGRLFSGNDKKVSSDLNTDVEESGKDKVSANQEKFIEASLGEAKPEPAAVAITPKDTVEAWLDNDPDSYQDDKSIPSTSSTGITPSSNSSSWGVSGSRSTK